MKSNFCRFISVLLLVAIVVMALSACGDGIPHEEHDTIDISERFVLISGQGYQNYIYVDKETRVMYWSTLGPSKSGLTPILKADGTPELYDGDL